MANGFYLMHRGWIDSPFFSKQAYCDRMAWVWLIDNAVWQKEGMTVAVNGNPTKIERGKLSYSIRYLAEAWGWKPARVQRFLKSLKKWNMIDTQTDTGRCVITICNYDRYQLVQNTERYTDEKKSIQERYSSDTNKNELNKFNELINIDLGMRSDVPSARSKEKKQSVKGTRLDPSMEYCPEEWGQWAQSEYRLTVNEVIDEFDKFRDYWISRAGSGGVKLDWQATWRNWVRKSQEYKANQTQGGYKK